MYISTRGSGASATAAEAITKGISYDGGLFVPQEIPAITQDKLTSLINLTYQERASDILQLFLRDYSKDELNECMRNAYNAETFSDSRIAPLTVIDEKISVLELWHGPTSAFKDMALQLMPHLLSLALAKTGEKAEIVILVATSGDTGKAALEGFCDVPQTQIIVFYPQGGVSDIQRLQMVTQEGKNVGVVAVKGNFDDTQTGVKRIFNDQDFAAELARRGFKFSSANSINWGRLAPQIAYYFSAYADLLRAGKIQLGGKINFVVPTGNFGNILAGYYAKEMGLPIHRLICAANSNNVLAEFLNTGTYDRNRPFHKTLSPSMDILISSNLERLLYHVTGGDCGRVSGWMKELTQTGCYQVDRETFNRIKQVFWAGWSDDDQTSAMINRINEQHSYSVDPHTAVAWHVYDDYCTVTGDETPTVIVSTASPFKFNESVLTALGESVPADEFDALTKLSNRTGQSIPAGLANLKGKAVVHNKVCGPDEMANVVRQLLRI